MVLGYAQAFKYASNLLAMPVALSDPSFIGSLSFQYVPQTALDLTQEVSDYMGCGLETHWRVHNLAGVAEEARRPVSDKAQPTIDTLLTSVLKSERLISSWFHILIFAQIGGLGSLTRRESGCKALMVCLFGILL